MIRLMALLGGLAALAGCTRPAPAMVPLVTLAGRACDAKPMLAAAPVLDPASRHTASATIDLDAGSPCLLDREGRGALYAAFRLHPQKPGDVLWVSSLPMGHALMAPHIMLFDGQGNPTRGIEFSGFAYRGTALVALTPIHADERFVVIGSASEMAGQAQDRLHSLFQATPVMVGPVVFTATSGAEDKTHEVLSLNGRLKVEFHPQATR
jgi:hypothetical protein